MKHFVLATTLACLLASSALAGDVPCGGYAPPEPDEQPESTLSAPGDVPSGGYTHVGSTEITVTVLQAILSLLSV